MRLNRIVTSLFVIIILSTAGAHAEEQPWVSLFDGKTMEKNVRTSGSVKIADGRLEITGSGDVRYDGYPSDSLRNIDVAMELMTEARAKGQLDFNYDCSGWAPLAFAQVVIDNSPGWEPHEYHYGKTGSLYCGPGQYKSLANDGEWFKLRVRIENRRVQVWVKETLVTDCKGPSGGRFDLRLDRWMNTKNPKAKISLKNLRFRLLSIESRPKETSRDGDKNVGLVFRAEGEGDFPLIDYHIHLKGDLTLEKALAHSRETGVFYGIAANCGLKFPITNDQGINDYVKKLEGQPCFVGMQAEGREWPTLFSKEAIAKFDYIFTDAMTIVDHRGKRARLWIPEEVDIPDKQAFMELLVRTIEEILDNEPVDIYANPTYLPDVLVKEYDTLWTPARVKRVIDAAARNGVAIEISNRLKLPKADFIRQAKTRGIKFTLGTNNVDSKLGREEYALQMIRECELKSGDMFLPKPDGKKPIQVRGFKARNR